MHVVELSFACPVFISPPLTFILQYRSVVTAVVCTTNPPEMPMPQTRTENNSNGIARELSQ